MENSNFPEQSHTEGDGTGASAKSRVTAHEVVDSIVGVIMGLRWEEVVLG